MLEFEQAKNQTRRKATERHAALPRGGKFSREQVQKTKVFDKLALLPGVKTVINVIWGRGY